MDQFLNSLPKTVLVLGSLILGLALLLMLNPPHSVCDSQAEVFHEQQKGFLYLDSNNKIPDAKTGFQKTVAKCKIGNSPGACFELFNGVRGVIRDLSGLQKDCRVKLASQDPVPKVFKETYELMVKLAWGSRPPETTFDKMGWLDRSYMEVFCDLQKWLKTVVGEDGWATYREELMQSLPEAKGLSRQELWSKTILSTTCSDY